MSDNFVSRVGLDTTDWKTGVAEIKRDNRVIESGFKAVAGGLDNWKTSADGLSAKQDSLNKKVENQKRIVGLLEDEYKNISQQYGETSREAQNFEVRLNNERAALNRNERELRQVSTALENYGDETNEATRDTKKLGNQVDKTSTKMAKFKGIMKGIGKGLAVGMAGIGLAVAGLGYSALKSGAEFEKSMSQVSATMGFTVSELNDGTSKASKDFKLLSDTAKEMGSTTQFSASQASESLNFLALAGYDAEKSIDTLPTVLNLAAAGGLELGYSADLLTDSMSSLGLSTDEASGFADKLAKTAQKSNTSVGQLGEGILTVGGTAKGLSGGVTELTTNLGLLADNGIKASEGGTKLRNIILSLSAPTDKAKGALKKLGVSTIDSEGNLRNINDVMKDLDGSLEGLGTAEKAEVLKNIFNKTDLKAVNALMGTSSERVEELSGAISNADGAAEEMAKTLNNNLQGSLNLVKSAWEGFNIALFEGDIDGMQTSIESLFSEITKIMTNYITPLIESIGSALKTALPLILVAIAEFIPSLLETVIGIVPVLIDALLNVIPDLINTIVSFIPGAIKMLLGKIPDLVQTILEIVTSLVSALGEMLPDVVITIVEIIPKIIDALLKQIPILIKTGFQLLVSLVTALPQVIKAIVKAIPMIINSIIDTIVELLPLIIESGIKLFVAIVEALPQIITTIIGIIPVLIDAITRALIELIPLIIVAGYDLFVAIIKELPAIIKTIIGIIPTIINAIVEIFTQQFSRIKDVGYNLITGLWEGIKGATNWLKNKITGFASGVLSSIKSSFGVKSPSRETMWIGDMLGVGLGKGIEGSINKIKQKTKKLHDAVANQLNFSNEKIKTSQTLEIERNVVGIDDASMNAITTSLSLDKSQTNTEISETNRLLRLLIDKMSVQVSPDQVLKALDISYKNRGVTQGGVV